MSGSAQPLSESTFGPGGIRPVAPEVQRDIAVVDGGSFVLPYVFGLVQALRRHGHRVTYYGSRTRYNAEFLEALRASEGVEVIDLPVSGTVAPRWRGVLAYARLLWTLWCNRTRHDTVNLQFSVLWPLELPLWWLLRKRLVFTVHNAVPHGFAGRRHRPTEWTARSARALIFPSAHTRDDFFHRYGQAWASRSTLAPHGLLALSPNEPSLPYRLPSAPDALIYWSTVKPYKGVELFAELARSDAVRCRGLALEVHGTWASELRPLKTEMVTLGVRVEDRFLDAAALRSLLTRSAVFLLPYREASQSGALYTLLNHGCYFLCTEVGDLGDFMRRFGLEALLLHDRSPGAVLQAVDHLLSNGGQMQRRFAEAQRLSQWDQAMDAAWPVYEAGP